MWYFVWSERAEGGGVCLCLCCVWPSERDGNRSVVLGSAFWSERDVVLSAGMFVGVPFDKEQRAKGGYVCL